MLALEWIFTGIFTVEYALRLYCVDKPLHYATSFFGLVDSLAVLRATSAREVNVG
ncbi:MAG TPA: hypothetical protein VM791_00175 [Vicinamibacterales bacterium]|nr:hypothetical protein [Vicinamibacterales bacterium]